MSWADAELGTIDLGDQRLNQRAIKIVEGLGLAPGRTIPQTFQSWSETKACYNFFSNDSVSAEKILDPHIANTIERVKEYPVVLFLSDTSELDYTSKESMEDRIRITNTKKGLWLHSTIAVTPDRLTLGTIEANFWNREEEVKGNNQEYCLMRDKTPIQEKESYRWLQNYQKSCDIAKIVPNTRVINIMDREADLIDIFDEISKQKESGLYADFIIRSKYDRLLIDNGNGTKKKRNKLRERLKMSSSLGEIEFTISPTEKRKGRQVKQQIKALEVTIKPANKETSAQVNAVMAIEENPPQGEDPLIWVFLTSLPIGNFEEVTKIISYYLCRWEIELFFKVLKSGCKIEERQLQTTDRMKSLLAVFMVLSWRVMFTMMLGRVCAEMSCADIFDDAEWKSVYKILNKKKPLPKKPPSIKVFIEMVAVLGGYVSQSNGGPPGVKVMWKGMARMVDFAIAWEAFGE